MHFIGIDIAKQKFDLAWTNSKGSIVRKALSNNDKGFNALAHWLAQRSIEQAHFCMEATGVYWEALAEFLCHQGFEVSVINPAQIKAFGESHLQRSKTDLIDAEMIMRFCKERQPKRWKAPPEKAQELKALVHRLDNLRSLKNQETNRLQVSRAIVQSSINNIIEAIDQEIKATEEAIKSLIDGNDEFKAKRDLLESIDGIGKVNSAMLLSYIGTEGQFENTRQVAAFAGLDVSHHQSGSSIEKKARLSKKGHPLMRKCLYMAAMVTLNKTEWGKVFRDRLAKRGKCPMVILGAMMRKLLHVAFGVLKTGRRFDASLHMAH